jgi:hypothetical protein
MARRLQLTVQLVRSEEYEPYTHVDRSVLGYYRLCSTDPSTVAAYLSFVECHSRARLAHAGLGDTRVLHLIGDAVWRHDPRLPWLPASAPIVDRRREDKAMLFETVISVSVAGGQSSAHIRQLMQALNIRTDSGSATQNLWGLPLIAVRRLSALASQPLPVTATAVAARLQLRITNLDMQAGGPTPVAAVTALFQALHSGDATLASGQCCFLGFARQPAAVSPGPAPSLWTATVAYGPQQAVLGHDGGFDAGAFATRLWLFNRVPGHPVKVEISPPAGGVLFFSQAESFIRFGRGLIVHQQAGSPEAAPLDEPTEIVVVNMEAQLALYKRAGAGGGPALAKGKAAPGAKLAGPAPSHQAGPGPQRWARGAPNGSFSHAAPRAESAPRAKGGSHSRPAADSDGWTGAPRAGGRHPYPHPPPLQDVRASAGAAGSSAPAPATAAGYAGPGPADPDLRAAVAQLAVSQAQQATEIQALLQALRGSGQAGHAGLPAAAAAAAAGANPSSEARGVTFAPPREPAQGGW